MSGDPRILIPDSRFGVRETGFSESWFGYVPLLKGAGLIHPYPDSGMLLLWIDGSQI